MITGLHTLLFSADPDADRTFIRDMLGFPHVDIGGGWLIFKLPPAELAVHPPETGWAHGLFLMCDDVHATVAELRAKGATFRGEVEEDLDAGLMAHLELPSGATIPVYQPKHEVATDLP